MAIAHVQPAVPAGQPGCWKPWQHEVCRFRTPPFFASNRGRPSNELLTHVILARVACGSDVQSFWPVAPDSLIASHLPVPLIYQCQIAEQLPVQRGLEPPFARGARSKPLLACIPFSSKARDLARTPRMSVHYAFGLYTSATNISDVNVRYGGWPRPPVRYSRRSPPQASWLELVDQSASALSVCTPWRSRAATALWTTAAACTPSQSRLPAIC